LAPRARVAVRACPPALHRGRLVARNLPVLRRPARLRRRRGGWPPAPRLPPLWRHLAIRQASLSLLRSGRGRPPGEAGPRGGAGGGVPGLRLPRMSRLYQGGGPAGSLERRPSAHRGLGLAALRSDRAPARLLAADPLDRPAGDPFLTDCLPSYREYGKIPPSLRFLACIRA